MFVSVAFPSAGDSFLGDTMTGPGAGGYCLAEEEGAPRTLKVQFYAGDSSFTVRPPLKSLKFSIPSKSCNFKERQKKLLL